MGKRLMQFMIIWQHWEWGDVALVVAKKGMASASISFRNDERDTGTLSQLYVYSQLRGKGYGAELQHVREEIARRRGCTHVHLWVDKKSWMKPWYNRRGYRKIGNKGKKEIWMRKKL